MTIYILFSLAVCILGGIVYAITDPVKHPEIKDMGKIAFSWGLLIFLFCVGCRGAELFGLRK